ncbi:MULTISPECIES: hypothetical protein [unclassified Dehalobacter]|uniref:hypothetical protein n=1 Tax=unclassified Dehalobacter TaxID=2635733 RepID=UPI001047FAE7|nr:MULTISPECIES: hypothetical protein [unclassified Dehalobacter]TCX51965.1 hypothetical protein C1I36_06505 [Dehalobacter sp. 14DCB1]TCX53025.1 hypothetical protein C1I38_08185 [Dehalobacter sp. 12DCB1]
MGRRNCRKNDQERMMHERAVRIRKMTDEQLCRYIDSLSAGSAGSKNRVSEFIQDLDIKSGTGNGIGKSTVYKLQIFAEKEGYI